MEEASVQAKAAAVRAAVNGNRHSARVFLRGRVESSNQVSNTRDGQPLYETILVLPAQDEYSHPQRFCLNSTSPLSRPGEMLDVEVEIQCRPWRDQYDPSRPNRQLRWHYPHVLWVVRG